MARTKTESKIGFFTEIFNDVELGKVYIQWLFRHEGYREPIFSSFKLSPNEIEELINLKINMPIDTILLKNDKDCLVFALCSVSDLKYQTGGIKSVINTKISLYVDDKAYVYMPWIL